MYSRLVTHLTEGRIAASYCHCVWSMNIAACAIPLQPAAVHLPLHCRMQQYTGLHAAAAAAAAADDDDDDDDDADAAAAAAAGLLLQATGVHRVPTSASWC